MRCKSCGGVLAFGRHASTRSSSSDHCASLSIVSPFEEKQNASTGNQFKRQQALVLGVTAFVIAFGVAATAYAITIPPVSEASPVTSIDTYALTISSKNELGKNYDCY